MIQTDLFENNNDQAVRVPASAPWLPRSVRDRLAEEKSFSYEFTWSKPERKTMRRQKKILCSEWSERYRVLTMSSLPGPWRNEVTQYLVGIMDAACFPSVRTTSICKCPQSGVSEAAHNFVGRCIDRDPGPVLYVYPDELTARDNSNDRIMPMIRSSRRLRGYLSGTNKDEATLRINLQHMPIYLAWARSASRLGNRPIKIAIADEVDKYPAMASKRESSPLDLIDKRLTTYRRVSKTWKISTPTIESGPIWQAITNEADVLFRFSVKCPLCGRHQLMEFDHIKWPENERDPRTMRKKLLAWYECAHCGGKWDDHLRDKAVSLGEWRTRDEQGRELELFAYLNAFRPQHIAFHLPSWIPRFVSLSECAAAFLEAETGDLAKKKTFYTQIKAEPYKQIVVEPLKTQYKTAICDLPAQTAPAEALALTAGIDCQMIGFYFLVRAWARDYTSWLIHYGKLDTWQDIETLLFASSYPVMGSNRRMAIARAAIDTGGSRFSGDDMGMTEAAYWWIRKNGVGRGARCYGIKGASWPQPNKIKKSTPIDKTPSGKPIPGGLQILTLDTAQLKDAFFYRLEQSVQGAPELCAWLHAETEETYFAHISAEHKVEDEQGNLKWVKKGNRRNDYLDCEVYAAAAADPEWPDGGIHLMVPPQAAQAPVGTRTPGPGQTSDRPGNADPGSGQGLPSWIRNY